MTSENYKVQNVHRYVRKTYKRNKRDNDNMETCFQCDSEADIADVSPRSDLSPVSCSCGVDTDGELASILHKKCAVIALAEQQLQRLINETDKILSENNNTRWIVNVIYKCKDILMEHSLKFQCILLTMTVVAFLCGLVLGAATCGTYLGRFESPILTCIDHMFIGDYLVEDTFRSIA